MPIPEKPVVLILEDDPFLALWYEDIIRYAGASVGASFPSCEAAEEWLSGREPDAAIVDVSLQDGSGAHLAKTLCGRKIPFLVVSSHPANSRRIDSIFKSGQWLQKPATPGEVKAALHALLSKEKSP